MSDARWLAILCTSRLCFGFIFMAYSGTLSSLMPAWGMSASQAGLIHTGWHAGYLVSLFAAGLLSDRFGAKRTFLSMCVLAVASAWLFAILADGFVSGLVLYTLAGLCSGGSYTPGLTLIAQRIPLARRGAAMGWYLAASSLGYAVALFVGGAVLSAWGWRATFLSTAVGPLVGLLLARWVLSDSRNVAADHAVGSSGIRSIVEVLRNKPAMLAIWSYSFHSWELLGLWAWLPTFLAASAALEHGAARAAGLGALLAGLTFVTNAVGSIAGGRLSDRLGRTSVMIMMTTASLACSLTFGWMFGAPLWMLTAVAIFYNLTALGDSSVYSSALTELVPAHRLGAAYSLRAVLGFGMGAVSPVAFGMVLDAVAGPGGERDLLAWGLAWGLLGVGALPGLFAIRWLRRLQSSEAGVQA
jgi:MFS family permease